MKIETDPDDTRLVYVPLDILQAPPLGLIEHRENEWWTVHPERGAIFFKPRGGRGFVAPQCNSNEKIIRMLAKELYPWADIVQVAHAFRVIDVRWYQE